MSSPPQESSTSPSPSAVAVEAADPSDGDDPAADPVAQELELVGAAAMAAQASAERRRRAALGRRRRRVCMVPQCYSSEASNPPVQLHSFPRSAAVSELWKRCVANPKLSTVATKLLCERQYAVCCQHFEPACYVGDAAAAAEGGRRQLRWNAVPTIGLAMGRGEPHPTGGAALYTGGAADESSSVGGGGGYGPPAAASTDQACSSGASDTSDCFHDGNLVIAKPEIRDCDSLGSDAPNNGAAAVPASPAAAVQLSRSPHTRNGGNAHTNAGSHSSSSGSGSSRSSSNAAATTSASTASKKINGAAKVVPTTTTTNSSISAGAAAAAAPADYSHEYTLLNRIVRIALGMDQAQAAMLRELCGLKRRQQRQQELLGHLCQQLARAVEEGGDDDHGGDDVEGETARADVASKRIRLE